ncbi:MAG TPA: tyrosine-type recombinase/integrase [Acidimicrobiales bacterium]
MSVAPWPIPSESVALYDAFVEWLALRKVGNQTFLVGARSLLRRFPDPQGFASLPLQERLDEGTQIRPMINFLMLNGYLHPGYDYLLERKLAGVLKEGAFSPLGSDVAVFLDAAEALGYSLRAREGMASQVAIRLLIESGKRLEELGDDDASAFETAIAGRELRHGREFKHYRIALFATRAVLYHLGAPMAQAAPGSKQARWTWDEYLVGTNDELRHSIATYLDRLSATLSRSTVSGTASELAHFGRFLTASYPELSTFADLDRRQHIEPYLAAVAAAVNHRSGEPVAISTRRSRIQAVGRMLEAMTEWGWEEAPRRRLIFERDSPRLPRPLPRYLPPDSDRRLADALYASPNRLSADALLLARATGIRIGELLDLELDCIHEVPGQGAWLKVPLGKLLTERMVPLDDDTVALVDRIVERRSPGRPLRHPRSGKLVEFLLTHHGRRVTSGTLRDELHRAADEAGLDDVVPHQLRHTFATALVNAGCSLQSLMAMLGHVSAEMSLRYGRLFDETVRAEYERALALAKGRLGAALPEATPVTLETDWRKAPLLKSRLSGGYCVRTLAQGACAYTNICEYCPNFRSDATFLPTLRTQRADAADLLADAEARGWGEEAARHRRLIDRLDKFVTKIEAESA